MDIATKNSSFGTYAFKTRFTGYFGVTLDGAIGTNNFTNKLWQEQRF